MVTMNNKFIKRFGKMILNAVVLLGFMACGNNVSAVNDKKSENSENGKKDKGKVLVVYFSQTGTTEGVAKIIARETDADLIKLEVKNEYTRDDLNWNNLNSLLRLQHMEHYQKPLKNCIFHSLPFPVRYKNWKKL